MNKEKFLPIGSVVLLKNAKKRIMVTGFAAKGKETGDKLFDYVGCLFPEGVISSDKNLLFNHDQIDKLYYIGYSDKDEKEFKQKLKEYLEKNGIEDLTNTSNVEETVVEEKPVLEEEKKDDIPDIPPVEVDPKMNELLDSLPMQ